MNASLYEFMNEPLFLKTSQSTDICYDICLKHYNAHDNFCILYNKYIQFTNLLIFNSDAIELLQF